MKKISLYLKVIFVAGFLGILHLSLTKKKLNLPTPSTVLLVGTADDYPPYTFTKDGKLMGFDIDLINHIAHQMGMNATFKVMSFDILLLELQKGRIHAIAAGLTPTQERAVKVFFTTPYLQSDPLLAVTCVDCPTVTCLSDMKHLKVIVNEGYTADFYLSQQNIKNLDRVETVAQAILALDRHKADVFVVSKSALQPFLKTRFCERFKNSELKDITESYALAVSKQYPELLEKIESALAQLKVDGTLETLKQKWELS